MSEAYRTQAIDGLMEEEIEEGVFPGAVLLVRKGSQILYHKAYGLKAEFPVQEEMETETIFDLASLIKVVVTTTLAVKLLEEETWRLSDPVGKYLKDFECSLFG